MKIILQKPVDKLGNPGDTAEVADGYARNYLIPRGLAVKAEKGTVRHAESLKRAHVNRLSKRKGEYEAIASKLISGVNGPADIGVDTKRNVVALPRFNAGRVECFTISK